ncbi:hypothetical protein Y032_0165g20 [Ancylostoma ceylanicum]|uniref:Uncharacterized protein n=1 Tax=Ancylostoma ceylanicum TaxID=53326 RepID=A0A016SWU5_9BILA|nr:hypothetical protein Y032_0165g20 [Ancylostoma ceylanicum]
MFRTFSDKRALGTPPEQRNTSNGNPSSSISQSLLSSPQFPFWLSSFWQQLQKNGTSLEEVLPRFLLDALRCSGCVFSAFLSELPFPKSACLSTALEWQTL